MFYWLGWICAILGTLLPPQWQMHSPSGGAIRSPSVYLYRFVPFLTMPLDGLSPGSL